MTMFNIPYFVNCNKDMQEQNIIQKQDETKKKIKFMKYFTGFSFGLNGILASYIAKKEFNEINSTSPFVVASFLLSCYITYGLAKHKLNLEDQLKKLEEDQKFHELLQKNPLKAFDNIEQNWNEIILQSNINQILKSLPENKSPQQQAIFNLLNEMKK